MTSRRCLLSSCGKSPLNTIRRRANREVQTGTESRSAPKGRQQMGETGFCKNLRFPAKICGFLRFSAQICGFPNPLIYRASRKSAKICKNLRKCAFRVRFLPFAVSLLVRPERRVAEKGLSRGVSRGASKGRPKSELEAKKAHKP